MSGGIFDLFIDFVMIFIVGIVIKLMDDYLDQDLDKIEGKYTLAMVLGKGVLPYALLFMVMSMALRPGLTGSLFLASYIIGMGHDLRRLLPFGWTGLQESIIFGAFGFLVFGFFEMLGSILTITFIQLVDDFLDYYTDAQYSRRNFIVWFGFWESIIGCLIIFVLTLLLDAQKILLVSIATPMVLWVLGCGKRLIKNE